MGRVDEGGGEAVGDGGGGVVRQVETDEVRWILRKGQEVGRSLEEEIRIGRIAEVLVVFYTLLMDDDVELFGPVSKIFRA